MHCLSASSSVGPLRQLPSESAGFGRNGRQPVAAFSKKDVAVRCGRPLSRETNEPYHTTPNANHGPPVVFSSTRVRLSLSLSFCLNRSAACLQNITTNVGSAGEGKEDEAKTEFREGDEDRPAHAKVLRWGNAAEVQDLMEVLETGHFDVVMGADLIYPEKVRAGRLLPSLLLVTDCFSVRRAGVRASHRAGRLLFIFAGSVKGCVVCWEG